MQTFKRLNSPKTIIGDTMSEHVKKTLPELWQDHGLRKYLGAIKRYCVKNLLFSVGPPESLGDMGMGSLVLPPVLSDGEAITIGKSFEQHKHVLVTGKPESGKSLIARWVGWRLSAGLDRPLPENLTNKMPIILDFERIAEENFRDCSKDRDFSFEGQMPLWHLVGIDASQVIYDYIDFQAIADRIEVGDCLLIIDNWDCISEKNLPAALHWVKEAVDGGAALLIISEQNAIDGLDYLHAVETADLDYSRLSHKLRSSFQYLEHPGLDVQTFLRGTQANPEIRAIRSNPQTYELLVALYLEEKVIPNTESELHRLLIAACVKRIRNKLPRGLDVPLHVLTEIVCEMGIAALMNANSTGRHVLHHYEVEPILKSALGYLDLDSGSIEEVFRALTNASGLFFMNRFISKAMMRACASLWMVRHIVSPAFVLNAADAKINHGRLVEWHQDAVWKPVVDMALATIRENEHPEWIAEVEKALTHS
jgi:hypothetical protein